MTTKSKTFYVSDNCLRAIKNDDETVYCVPSLDEVYINKITIFWKEDRKAEVTESQIDEIVSRWESGYSKGFGEFLKERIFKDAK